MVWYFFIAKNRKKIKYCSEEPVLHLRRDNGKRPPFPTQILKKRSYSVKKKLSLPCQTSEENTQTPSSEKTRLRRGKWNLPRAEDEKEKDFRTISSLSKIGSHQREKRVKKRPHRRSRGYDTFLPGKKVLPTEKGKSGISSNLSKSREHLSIRAQGKRSPKGSKPA